MMRHEPCGAKKEGILMQKRMPSFMFCNLIRTQLTLVFINHDLDDRFGSFGVEFEF